MARAHHLHDGGLLDCYLAERHQQAVEQPLTEHLAGCPDCRARYGALVRFLDELRSEADVESDEFFTRERLRAQQLRIARRIEHVGQAARILSFPARLIGRPAAATSDRRASRWVYAAAVAGLAIGVAFGSLYDFRWHAAEQARQVDAPLFSVPGPARFTPITSEAATVTLDHPDDVFLSELETALERPQTPALQPLDALTPHVRPVTNRVR